ncbi:MAG: hypothetical protein E6I01_05015 [Chloroflexi bacterium]|nr:MAG: hypothetical protein E6I01_05015 [Chloroflexota bacterium]
MTTSSSEGNRCTRISPSAVLDDRLDGKDLEWARDHLRRCEACRDRVEDFREMLLRVGRLPSAAVGAAAMDQAFAAAIPDRLRSEAGSRSFEIAPPLTTAPTPLLAELPTPMRPEVTSVPDLLIELEREIFRDEPGQDHPTSLSPISEPIYPTMTAAPVEEIEAVPPTEDVEAPEELAAPPPLIPATPEPVSGSWREVHVDSHREPEPAVRDYEPEAGPPGEPMPAPTGGNVVFEQDPALRFDEEIAPATLPRKPDTAMRLAVGLGAAACVLLAAVLYEGGWLAKGLHNLNSTAPTATATLHPSASASPRLSAPPSVSPPPPPAPVLFTLGNAVSGNSVFRIRPGTAVAGYTRLVFDMHGSGLPTMVITRPDDLHVAITFKNSTVTGIPVNGIRSYQIAGIEPAVQQGSDGTITIDLARSVRVTAFTLPATGGYSWRLVLDLHTA